MPVCQFMSRLTIEGLAILPEQNRLKTMHAHCELPPVISPRIGAAREVIHASFGYAQLKLISSYSTWPPYSMSVCG